MVILPVLPLSVNVVEFVPEQTSADPAIVPPTLAGLTVPDTEIVSDILPEDIEIVPVKVPALAPVNLIHTVVFEIIPLEVRKEIEEVYVPLELVLIS